MKRRSATSPHRTPVVRMRGICKSFGAVQALQQVDFEAYAGEAIGLVGDNGAGKSTLIKILSGAYTADRGETMIDGKRVTISKPGDATRYGIETVYQDLALCDNLDVVSNLYLGHEEVRGFPFLPKVLDQTTMEQRTSKILQQLRITLPSLHEPVGTLSGGQRQSIAVAKAVLRHARAVVLDEPTAALGVVQTQQVLDLIQHLREQGLAVILISHNLENVFRVADRAIVLRLGKRVATFDLKQATQEEVVAAITGADESLSSAIP